MVFSNTIYYFSLSYLDFLCPDASEPRRNERTVSQEHREGEESDALPSTAVHA